VIIRKKEHDCIDKRRGIMRSPSTPLPTDVPALDQQLRESHVRERKETPPEVVHGVEISPRETTEPVRLRIVSSSIGAPPDEDDGSDDVVVPMERRAEGLVALERAVIKDESEAKFHKRETIERTVRSVRRSSIPPPAVTTWSVPWRLARLRRLAVWVGCAAAVCTVVVAAILVANHWNAVSSGRSATVPSVRIDLGGVPEGARVSVDGVPSSSSTSVELVLAEGFEPWTLTLTPTASREVPVRLVPSPSP
jgi:hypothetical protein